MRLLSTILSFALPTLSSAFLAPNLASLGVRIHSLSDAGGPASAFRGTAACRMPRSRTISTLSMSTVRQVALEEDLMGVVAMAGQPLPNRPDGTVVVVAYSSTEDYGCMATDAEFGRLSEKYPDCVFLVCHKEYVGAEMTMSSRGVTSLPSFEVFSRGSRVAVVTGPRLDEVETKIKQFGFSLSKTDLFSDKSAFSLNSYDQQFPEGPGRGGVDSASEENASSNPWDDAADKVKAEAPHPPLPPRPWCPRGT